MEVTEGAACIPNIGPRERRWRLSFGIIGILAGGAAAVALSLAPVSRWWRLPLFLLFWGGATGIFQAREQTCIALAARGVRNLDDGIERIDNAAEQARIDQQARKVRLESTLLAIALTGIATVIPARLRRRG